MAAMVSAMSLPPNELRLLGRLNYMLLFLRFWDVKGGRYFDGPDLAFYGQDDILVLGLRHGETC